MVAEFLVVGGPRYHGLRILESFKTQEEAETHAGILGMEPTDEDIVHRVCKVDPARIRKRASYELFRDMADFFKQEHSTQEILEYIYSTIDSCRGWGLKQMPGMRRRACSIFSRTSEKKTVWTALSARFRKKSGSWMRASLRRFQTSAYPSLTAGKERSFREDGGETMSTRAMVGFTENGNFFSVFYRHCDGYPTCLGEELLAALKETNDQDEIAREVRPQIRYAHVRR